MDRPIVAVVADDHPEVRAVLAAVLADAGCTVHAAEDGLEAVRILEREDVAILLLDLSMPNLDGFGVLEQMRERKQELAQPLTLIVTANADVDGRVRGTELGAIDFVDKPFRVPGIRMRIERLISMVNMERGVDDAEASLATLRSRDPVTGDGTFTMLRPVLEAQFQSAHMTERPLSCLVVCDDSYNALVAADGIKAGEMRLGLISKTLNSYLRGADLVFRVDAAEFVLLLPGTPVTGASRVIVRLAQALETLGEEGATLYFAAATYPHPQIARASELFRAASVTLAQARSRESRAVAHFGGF